MSRKEELLDSTFVLFARDGYHLKISDVTERVGIKKQSIYNYFSSKDELIQTMLKNKVNEYYEFMESFFHNLESLPLQQVIRGYVTKVFDFYSDSKHLMSRRWLSIYISLDMMKNIRKLIAKREQDITGKLLEILRASNRTENDLLYLQVLIRGLLDGRWLTEVNKPIDETIEIIMNCYFKKDHA